METAAAKSRRAGASARQDLIRAVRWRLQPTRHASPRGRPRPTTVVATDGKCQAGEECSPVRASVPPCSGRSRPTLAAAANAANLDRPCARRLRDRRPGRKNDLWRGRTKEWIRSVAQFTKNLLSISSGSAWIAMLTKLTPPPTKNCRNISSPRALTVIAMPSAITRHRASPGKAPVHAMPSIPRDKQSRPCP